MDEKQILATEGPGRFTTLNELRLAHLQLMEGDGGQEDYGKEPILSGIKAFVSRVKATGVVLGENVDRREAQGILDYWSSNLVSIGGVDLRTWSQPRLDGFDRSALADVPGADTEQTKAEFSKIDDKSLQLVRIGALARQWKTSGMGGGYLLTDKALKQAAALKGQDADVDLFLSASEVAAQKSTRNLRWGALALFGFLVLAVVMSAVTANKLKENELKVKIENVERQNDQISEVFGENLETIEKQTRFQNSFNRRLIAQAPVKDLKPMQGFGIEAGDSSGYSPWGPGQFPEDLMPALPPPPKTYAPDIKALDAVNEEDRMAAALAFNRLLRSKDNSPADRLGLATNLIGQTAVAQFASLSPDGRHYLMFVLSLIPTQNWDDPEWSAIRDDLRKNLLELQSEIAANKISLDQKSQQYLDALRSYVGTGK